MKVGIGTAIITPDTMPVHLAGFIEPQVAHEVRDDLEVRAVYVAKNDVAVCLLVCDLMGMSHHFADPVRAAVGAAIGLERAAVLTSCVHTHAGPSTMAGTEALGWPTPPGYLELLVERCVTAAVEAKAVAEDATLRFGRWALPGNVSVNRRGHPYDPWFSALDVHGASGRIATIANLSIHPVALGPECLAVATDWVGPFRRALESRAGGQVVMLQGTSGDVNPHHVHRQNNDCDEDLFAEADDLGAQLARAVHSALHTADEIASDGPAIERHHTFDVTTGDTNLSRAGQVIPVELIEWSLGPVRVVSVPGEGFHELGRQIETRAGGSVLLAGLAPIWQGYLPEPFTAGYEEDTSYGRDFVAAVAAALT